VTAVRLSPAAGAQVDKWAASQADAPTRSEAIRRLVELGLTVRATKPKQPPLARAVRAKELAWQAIYKMGDPAASAEERDERRRRLAKGPPEFSRGARRSREEMKWARDPRVLACIIAALIFVIWMGVQQQYY
jgi:hypothetical protein